MITLRKLASLSAGTRRRKTAILLRDFERLSIQTETVDCRYLRGLLEQIATDAFWSGSIREAAAVEAARLTDSDSQLDARRLNELRHRILAALGRDWADWDEESAADGGGRPGFWPFRVYLDGVRSPFNVGSAMRTALAFGMERLWVSPDAASPTHRRAKRSAMGAVDTLPWDVDNAAELDRSRTGTLFALELGGTEVERFPFPAEGTVVIGSEELGVSPAMMSLARSDGGVVSIPLPGPKASLNLGVAFGIVTAYWVEAQKNGA